MIIPPVGFRGKPTIKIKPLWSITEQRPTLSMLLVPRSVTYQEYSTTVRNHWKHDAHFPKYKCRIKNRLFGTLYSLDEQCLSSFFHIKLYDNLYDKLYTQV